MNTTGALPPRRASLTRVTQAPARIHRALQDTRAWARERRHALAYFGELGLNPGATVPEVLDAVIAAHGRHVEPVPLSSLPPKVSGVAVLGETQDYIFLSDRLSPRHQVGVLLHEIRHLRPAAADPDGSVTVHSHFDGVTVQHLMDKMSALPPKVREELLTRPAKFRSGYEHDEERSCEVFARVVLPLLSLDSTGQRTGPLNAAFGNRRDLGI